MDENEIYQKIQDQDKKLDAIYRSVEKTRKYFLWTLIISVVVFILPLLGLIVVIPQFLSLYSGLGDLGL